MQTQPLSWSNCLFQLQPLLKNVKLFNRNTKTWSSNSYLTSLESWVCRSKCALHTGSKKVWVSASVCFFLMVKGRTPRSRCKGAEILTCCKYYLQRSRTLPSPQHNSLIHITALNYIKHNSRSWVIIGKVISKNCVLPGRVIEWAHLQLNIWKK